MISSYKLTDNDISTKGVVAAPTVLSGTATQNKQVFDRLIREVFKADFNNLIDALTATGGAGEIGATVPELSGATVQAVLLAMKALVDTKTSYTYTDTLLGYKSDKSVTDLHIKTVTLAPTTGVFTFTREDGTSFTIDTLLEKIAVNFSYDAETEELVLTLADGSTQRISLAALISTFDFIDSGTIAWTVSNQTVTANIKAGSITETHLSSSVNASLDLADSAYQKPSTGIAKTDLASDVQTSLGKADSAVQDIKVKIGSGTAATIVSSNVATLEVAEGTTNGTIKVAGSDVAVHGLGSAAYTPTTDYATAAQGAKADTAVQPADLGNVAPASADNSTVEVSGTTLQVKDGGITTAKLATLTSFKLVDTANDGSAYVGQVYQITIDHGAIMVTPVAS